MFGMQTLGSALSTVGNLFRGDDNSTPYPVAKNPESVPVETVVQAASSLFGPPRRGPDLSQDAMVSDVIMTPYRDRFDFGNYARENQRDYYHYRYQYRTDPVLRSAILGKTTSLSCLDVTILPGEVSHPEQVSLANEIADFVDHTISKSDGGWTDVIDKIYGPAPVDGFTLCPKKLKPGVRWRGRSVWGFDHLRQLDVTPYIRLQTDVYRNVVAIVNTVRGLEYYPPTQAILFNLNPQYGDPFGQSDISCVTQASDDIVQVAYKAWLLAVKVFGLPYMVANAGKPTQKAAIAAALEGLRQGGYIVLDKDDKMNTINLAAASGMNGFKDLIHTRREDIFFGVRGVAQPYMEGDGGSAAHTDTEVQKTSADSRTVHDSKRVANCLQHQLIPWLVEPNWGPDAPMPTVLLGGVNWKTVKDVTDVLSNARKELGLNPSKQFVQKALGIPEARDKTDELGEDKADPGSLIGTTQGLSTLSQYQTSFTSGQISQAACVAAMQLIFKLPEAEALKLFPPVKPVDRTQPDQPPGGAPPPGGSPPAGAPAAPPPTEPAAPATFSTAHGERWQDEADQFITEFGRLT